MINEILFRRKNKVYVDNDTILKWGMNPETHPYKDDAAQVVSAIKNLEEYGFTMDEGLSMFFAHLGKADVRRFYCELIELVEKKTGADKVYNPMYPNFPNQVMEASDAELFWNAIIHYWSYGTLMPEYKKERRMPLVDNPKLKVLSLGFESDLYEIFTNLLSSKTSTSALDKEDIKSIIKDTDKWTKYLPETIPHKENVAFFGALVIQDNLPVKLTRYIKTATDVLRTVVAMSNGDISLATKTRFRKLKRRERWMIMNLLRSCGNIKEDMFRYQKEWIRIGEIVHPRELANKYKGFETVLEAFDALRKNDKPLYFNAKVHQALNNGDMVAAAELLQQRPGEFARLLDKCLRDAEDQYEILDMFKKVASQVSIPVLLQVKYHFFWRINPDEYRVIFPKGNTATASVIPYDLRRLDQQVCMEVINVCSTAIKEQLSTREPLGKVFVDYGFENYMVPASQRSASNATKMVTRGSRFKIASDAAAIRAFIWWTNTERSRVDIDLSAAIYDKEWQYITHVSYTQLRDAAMKMYHSGDIVKGGPIDGNGVAEFLDFDIKAISERARYLVIQVYSFTQQPFASLPNCRFGWMSRVDVGSGEIFEPKTVELSMDVRSNSTVCIPAIFDCKEREVIWCDINADLRSSSKFIANNLESNLRNVNFTCYAMTHMVKANMLDLIRLNVEARGEGAKSREEADVIFSNDTTKPKEIITLEDGTQTEVEKDVKIVTAYDLDYWMSQMM